MPAKPRIERNAAMDTVQRRVFRDRLGLPSGDALTNSTSRLVRTRLLDRARSRRHASGSTGHWKLVPLRQCSGVKVRILRPRQRGQASHHSRKRTGDTAANVMVTSS
jgi:hypothetical protein